jgi:folate-binding protein YgfZ
LDAHYINLKQDALLHISGPDSLQFLQGQTTCDTNQLDDAHAILGAYCNPQGRMVCDFLLCQLGDDHYAMRMRADTIQNSATTFGKYIVFSKADLDSDNRDWQTFALYGDNARQVLGDIFPNLPEEKLGAVLEEDYVLVQIDETGNQYECYINGQTQSELVDRLTTTLPLSSESVWQSLQIESGIGRIEPATVEEFIPQMLNFDITGHVSFTKGCYTGQEVVARMHYRGKPKRRMYLASLPDGSSPESGTALFTGDKTQSVGNVVNSAVDSSTQVVLLVVATVDGVESGLHVGAIDGPLLNIRELPYSL